MRRTILIVEDEPAQRQLLTLFLPLRGGFNLVVTAKSDEALEALRSPPPGGIQLVLTDHRFQGSNGMTGLELAEFVAGWYGIPVVIVSADDIPAGHSAAALVEKPYDLDTLLLVVNAVLAEHERQSRPTDPRALACG